jgi:oligosaccharide repeat unit polymerase
VSLTILNNSENLARHNFPTAPIELAMYVVVASFTAFLHVAGWLSLEMAAVVTACLLLTIIARAWKAFDGGRHPAFLFLCSLTLFQAGRLFGYCLGLVEHPLRIELMTSTPFDPSTETQAIVMLMIIGSVVAVYAPSRFWYRRLPVANAGASTELLPYLRLVFWLTIPVQLFKNFSYFQYARANGGYLVYFLDHDGLAGSVPFWVRAVSLITLPTFVVLFALEKQERQLYLATAAYFLSSALILMIGSRGSLFGLMLSLWFVASRRTHRPVRAFKAILALGVLAILGAGIGLARNDSGQTGLELAPLRFVIGQGASLNVTEVAVEYRHQFTPHLRAYMSHELMNAFAPGDQGSYRSGQRFASDIAVLLNRKAFDAGFGSGSAYLAESYVVGGFVAVIAISLAIGCLLHTLSRISSGSIGLACVGLLLPDLLWMPRAGLLDWVSAGLRNAVMALTLFAGWRLYKSVGLLRKSLAPVRLETPPTP